MVVLGSHFRLKDYRQALGEFELVPPIGRVASSAENPQWNRNSVC
jgi:hypothetical protein